MDNELQNLAKQMQDYARLHPCLIPIDGVDPGLSRMIGEDLRVSLALELHHKKPLWHGSVCGLYEIARGGDNVFGMPERAILNVEQWTHEQRSIAEEILGYCMADMILDKHQRVAKQDGMFSLHWLTEAHPKTMQQEAANG